jgi:hypothetical protein
LLSLAAFLLVFKSGTRPLLAFLRNLQEEGFFSNQKQNKIETTKIYINIAPTATGIGNRKSRSSRHNACAQRKSGNETPERTRAGRAGERERERDVHERNVDRYKIFAQKDYCKTSARKKILFENNTEKKKHNTNATTTTQMPPPATKTSMQRKALERLETRQETGKTEHTWEEKSEFSSLQKYN